MNKMSEFTQELSCQCADKSNVVISVFINLWCPCHRTDKLTLVSVSLGLLSAEVFSLSSSWWPPLGIAAGTVW